MPEDSPAKKSKRQVRNPETFRERALKASEADAQPTRRSAVKRGASKVVRPIGLPFKRAARFRPIRILGKILFPPYIRNSWAELRQVNWPTWQQSRQLTFAVLAFAIVFGAVIAGVDYGLDKVFRNVLLK